MLLEVWSTRGCRSSTGKLHRLQRWHGLPDTELTERPWAAQVVEGLRACHSTGIVHRDVKPQNVIICGEDQCTKMIDLGAAADLRVGINYVPNEFLLDPRYAPPEQYIMSTQVLLTASAVLNHG